MEKKNDFKPFISADKVLPEFTVTSVNPWYDTGGYIWWCKRLFGAKSWYDCISLHSSGSYFHGCDPCDLKESSILENNMVQTIGSAGESLAAGQSLQSLLFLFGHQKREVELLLHLLYLSH